MDDPHAIIGVLPRQALDTLQTHPNNSVGVDHNSVGSTIIAWVLNYSVGVNHNSVGVDHYSMRLEKSFRFLLVLVVFSVIIFNI